MAFHAGKKIYQKIEFLKTSETVNERIFFPSQDARDNFYGGLATASEWQVVEHGNAKQKGAKIYVYGQADQFPYNYCRIAYKYNISETNYDTSKYMYYFIYNIEQVNPKTIELTLALDIIGTYFHDINYNRRIFVERSTPLENTFGENRVAEYYDLGEHRAVWAKALRPAQGKFGYLIACAESPCNSGKFECNTSYVNGVWSGLSLFYYKSDEFDKYCNFLNFYNTHGHIDSIISISTYPDYEEITKGIEMKSCTWKNTSQVLYFRPIGTNNLKFKYISEVYTIGSTSDIQNGAEPGYIGYSPVCKKLLQYPYTFYQLENSVGGARQYRPENIAGDTMKVESDTMITTPPTIEFYLTNYNGSDKLDKKLSAQQSISLGGYGLINWCSDYTKTWNAQNEEMLQATRLNTIDSFNTTMENAGISAGANETIASNTLNSALQMSGNNYNIANIKNDTEYGWNQLQSSASLAGDTIGLVTRKSSVGDVIGDTVQMGKNYSDHSLNSMANNVALNNSRISANTAYANSMVSSAVAYTTAQNNATTAYNNAMRSLVASQRAIQSMPSTVKGDTSTNHLDLVRQTNNIYFKVYQGDGYLMQRLDEYFRLYGYQQNRRMEIATLLYLDKSPFTVSKNDDYKEGCIYVKTVGANFTCKTGKPIPKMYVDAINEVFDSGLRIWYNTTMSLDVVKNDFYNEVIEPEFIDSELHLRGSGGSEFAGSDETVSSIGANASGAVNVNIDGITQVFSSENSGCEYEIIIEKESEV